MTELKRFRSAASLPEGVSRSYNGILLPRNRGVLPDIKPVLIHQFFCDGIHFKREWLSLKKCGAFTARSLLGLAAPYAGTIVEVHVITGCGPDHSHKTISSLVLGIRAELAMEGVRTLWTATTETPRDLIVGIALLVMPSPSYENGISGVREGDSIYVTGFPGVAGAVRSAMSKPGTMLSAGTRKTYLYPDIRVQCGRILAREMLHTGVIVLQRGLRNGLQTIADTAHVRIVIERNQIPVHPAFGELTDYLESPAGEQIFSATPCYELAFSVPPEQEARLLEIEGTGIFGVSLHRIGKCISGKPEIIISENGSYDTNL